MISESSRINDKRGKGDGSDLAHGGNIYAFARARGIDLEKVLDFSASINPLGLPFSARQVFRRAFRGVAHYPEPYAESLTQTLAKYHTLSPSEVLVGNGATHLIYLLARVLPVRRVVLIAPLFSEHASAFRAHGVYVCHMTLRPPSFALNLAKVEKTLRKEQPDALVLTNPNSPTGTLTLRKQVCELVRLCRRTHTRLIADETFIDWTEGESVKHLAVRDDGVIVLRSLTKFFALPGLRLGYVIASPKIIRKLRLHIEPWSVNSVAQEVGTACLQDQRFIERGRVFVQKERLWFSAQLNLIPHLQVFPSSANFLLLRIMKKDMSAAFLAERLAREKILVRVCDNFVGLGKRFFRVAVRKRAENHRFLEALGTLIVHSNAFSQ